MKFETEKHETLDIHLTTVEGSSMITAQGYHAEEETLRVQFKGGKEYDYFPVSKEKYEAMLAAESVGKFINAEIKPACACRPVIREKVEA